MISSFLNSSRRFFKIFRQAYIVYDTLDNTNFDDFNARILRYAMLFASYENTLYDDLRTWSIPLKTNNSLYQYIRNIYNPSYRLTEFWRAVTWGGMLDKEAGEDGVIPIEKASNQLRKAIATVWKWSNWSLNKDLVTLYGSTMGDVGIKVIDNVAKQRTYFKVIHPNTIRDVDIDHRGFCQGYVIEETRYDEEKRPVSYVEVCERESGDRIRYRTFRDGVIYPWNGVTGEWTAEYGFVPFAMIRHNFVGNTYGWAEMQPHRPKIQELDEQASKLHDYIRKVIDPIWLFNFKKPRKATDLKAQKATGDEDNPQPGREELEALYVPDARAKAQPLVTEGIDIEKVSGVVNNIIAELERDLPELQMDIWTAGGYTTGKALKTARQRVEKKVIMRRPAYDDPLIQLNGMAVAIGGERGYPGYEGFNLSSYATGKLDHFIPTNRPIFDTDALETIEKKQIFWNVVYTAMEKGADLVTVLTDLGWSEQKANYFISKLPPKPVDNNPNLGDEQDVQNTDVSVG